MHRNNNNRNYHQHQGPPEIHNQNNFDCISLSKAQQRHQQPKHCAQEHQNHQNRYHYRYAHDFDEIDDRIFEYNNHNTNYNLARSHLSPSPVREQTREPVREALPRETVHKNQQAEKRLIDYELEENLERYDYDSAKNPEDFLRYKWLDNTPRMSRIRDHRNKRLINRLEVC